jgi:hypothetical protein
MTYLHQRQFTLGGERSDAGILAYMASVMPPVDSVMLPIGGSFEQGFSNKCGAAAVWNTLETCDRWLDEPLPTVDTIYEKARLLAGFDPWDKGSLALHCAEAACQLLDGAANWMLLPLDPQVLGNWLLVEKTAIAYAMDWTSGHNVSRIGKNKILFPNAEKVAQGHMISIRGFQKSRSYREGFFLRRKKSVPVFALENTHVRTSDDYFIQAAEIPVQGRMAIVFVPPTH